MQRNPGHVAARHTGHAQKLRPPAIAKYSIEMRAGKVLEALLFLPARVPPLGRLDVPTVPRTQLEVARANRLQCCPIISSTAFFPAAVSL
jgi:hypothetical protein